MGKIMYVNDIIEGPTRVVTAENMAAFESVVWQRPANVHSDPAAAVASGMARPIASGQYLLAFFHELMEQSFGRGWLEGGQISARWIRPVYAGETLSVFGKVEEIETAGERPCATLSVWAKTKEGQSCAAGTAKGFLA